jgi:hypothetical protein
MNKYRVVACGVTAENRPNVILEDENINRYTLWYSETFYRINDTLNYLKVLYKEGISQEAIDDGYWLTLKQLQNQGE